MYVERTQRSKPQSIAQQVIDTVREMILSGELAEGVQLRQDMLATMLQVSRIPVREALRKLEAEGLVSFFPHRGAVVSALSAAEIRELFEARALLECDLLAHAVPNMTAADLSRAEAALKAFNTAIDRCEMGLCSNLNWRFHSALYAAADRPLVKGLVRNLSINIDRYLRLHFQISSEVERARRDHQRILSLCRAKRTEAACDSLRKHIENAGTGLMRFLEAHRSGHGLTAPQGKRPSARPRRAIAVARRRRSAPLAPA